MQEIYELFPYAVRSLEILDVFMPKNEKGLLDQLKNIVLLKDYRSEEAIMKELYGKKNSAAFSKLKARFKEILIQCLLTQKLNHDFEFSRNNQSFIHLKQAIAYKLLFGLKAHRLSVKLAEKSINSAIKYHLTEIVIMYAGLLVRHYGSSEYNKFKYSNYLTIQKRYVKIQRWEIKSEQYYYNLQTKHLNSLSTPNESARKIAKKYVEKLNSIKNVDSYTFTINKFRVNVVHFEYDKNYGEILNLTEEILNAFGPLFRSTTFYQIVYIRKMWALIQTGKNEVAISDGHSVLNKVISGSLGWYFVLHYITKAQLYKADYHEAIELIDQAINHPKFARLSENVNEIFKVTLGYIHLITAAGLAGDPNKAKQKLPEFKLYKFLNAIPVFSKDKRGLNVSILLMHIGFLLLRKDYNAIIDRVDSLNYYANKHLRKDDTFRSNCMIKMVIQMTKADFNPIRTARYTEELFKKLQDVKLAGSGENIETEIIPYEVLWQIMLKACETNYSTKRSKVIA